MIDRRIGKVKVRRGNETQRRSVVFEEGELVYSIDKKRLFIGDGYTNGGILVSNKNYIVTLDLIPSTATYGDIIHNKDNGRTFIVGYDTDGVTLKLFLIADSYCCINLQREIDDLYTKLRTLTACLSSDVGSDMNGGDGTGGNGGTGGGSGTGSLLDYMKLRFVLQPISYNGFLEDTVTFSVSAVGPGKITYQWKRLDTGTLFGKIKPKLEIVNAQINDIADYICVATSSILGSITSNPVSLLLDSDYIQSEDSLYILDEASGYTSWDLGANGTGTGNPVGVAPKITTQPTSKTTTSLVPVTYTVVATGTEPLYYQWRANGSEIFGATSSSYTFTNPTESTNSIICRVSNSYGVVDTIATSMVVFIKPSIVSNPVSKTIFKADRVAFSVTAQGSEPLTYQWTKDGTPIVGANSNTYVINSAILTNRGLYRCIVSNPIDHITSEAASLDVTDVYNVGDILISKDTNNFNLKTVLLARGWDENLPVAANIIVERGVVVGSSSTALPSILVDPLVAGSLINLTNNGYIIGAGGDGGSGGISTRPSGSNGNDGGTALKILHRINITNNNIIAGGGGGGAGGAFSNRFVSSLNTDWNADGGGGGGGGGRVGGKGGLGAVNGALGDVFGGGTGGSGIIFGTSNPVKGVNGAKGGDLGMNGENTQLGENITTTLNAFGMKPASGGKAGCYVDGDAYVIWVTKGDLKGNYK